MTTKRLWFARKRYGWGWTPVAWQGWAAVAGYGAFVASGAFLFLRGEFGARGVLAFAVWTLGYTIWLLSLTWHHGPAPRWQWGNRAATED